MFLKNVLNIQWFSDIISITSVVHKYWFFFFKIGICLMHDVLVKKNSINSGADRTWKNKYNYCFCKDHGVLSFVFEIQGIKSDFSPVSQKNSLLKNLSTYINVDKFLRILNMYATLTICSRKSLYYDLNILW